jgi:hypothetical protein
MASFNTLCDSCKHKGCCTDSAVPLVFSYDFEDLKSIGKANDDFLKEVTVHGKKIKAIKKKNDSTSCMFWDDKKMMCSIYEKRPFDCRAYPFDIHLVNGKYHWIVYSCNPESNWTWSEEYLQSLENDKQFNEIMEKIEIFAGHTKMILPQESQKTPFIVLREVRYKKS